MNSLTSHFKNLNVFFTHVSSVSVMLCKPIFLDELAVSFLIFLIYKTADMLTKSRLTIT